MRRVRGFGINVSDASGVLSYLAGNESMEFVELNADGRVDGYTDYRLGQFFLALFLYHLPISFLPLFNSSCDFPVVMGWLKLRYPHSVDNFSLLSVFGESPVHSDVSPHAFSTSCSVELVPLFFFGFVHQDGHK